MEIGSGRTAKGKERWRQEEKKKDHPGSLLPIGCPIIESNNMAVQR